MKEKLKIGGMFISPEAAVAKFVLEDGSGFTMQLQEKHRKQIADILIKEAEGLEKIMQELKVNKADSTNSILEDYSKACNEEEIEEEFEKFLDVFRITVRD